MSQDNKIIDLDKLDIPFLIAVYFHIWGSGHKPTALHQTRCFWTRKALRSAWAFVAYGLRN